MGKRTVVNPEKNILTQIMFTILNSKRFDKKLCMEKKFMIESNSILVGEVKVLQ